MSVFSRESFDIALLRAKIPAGVWQEHRWPILALTLSSLIIQTFYMIALPISFEGDAGGYYANARWLAGYDHDWFMWWRPPGFPAYLHVLGMTWLDSFNGVLAANTLLGISMPLLLYGALVPIGKRWAFGAALLFVASTDAFSYAKVLITEHPYSFFTILIAFGLSRFIVTLKPLHGAVAMGAVLVALMMRNEAILVGIGVAGVGLTVAFQRQNWRAVVSFLMSIMVVYGAILGWSWYRSRVLSNPDLFGSLHNFGGRQSFWRLYTTLGGVAAQFPFSRPKDDDRERWTQDKQVLFVVAKNGPASAELGEMFPEALLNPTDALSWTIGQEVYGKKGILETDKFFKAVVSEAITAHPEILPLLVLTAAQHLGVYIPGYPPGISPFFTWWTFDTYEAMPYNIGTAAEYWLTPHLFSVYTKSQWQIEDVNIALSRPAWNQSGRPDLLNRIHHFGQTMHNVVRNSTGLLLILTIWFLPFTRHKALAIFLVFSCGVFLASAAIGFGFNGRYEHFIVPYLIMTAALSMQACGRAFYSLMPRGGRDSLPANGL